MILHDDAPTKANVDQMLDFLKGMAKTYATMSMSGLSPEGYKSNFPEIADTYGAFDPDDLQAETRIPRPRPDPWEIDEAEAVWRVAIRALTRDQLWWIMIEGDGRASSRMKQRLSGVKHETLCRYQRDAATCCVKFLLQHKKSWTQTAVLGSILVNAAVSRVAKTPGPVAGSEAA
ncbi:MAG: hypothetical protein AAF360_10035 [Pseudomonadota bacterium]